MASSEGVGEKILADCSLDPLYRLTLCDLHAFVVTEPIVGNVGFKGSATSGGLEAYQSP